MSTTLSVLCVFETYVGSQGTDSLQRWGEVSGKVLVPREYDDEG